MSKSPQPTICYLDHAPYEGGAEVSLKELLEQLVKNENYHLVVIAPPNAPYLAQHNSRIHHIPFTFHWNAYKFLVPLLYDFLRLLFILITVRPDIIHANTRVTNQLAGMVFLIRRFIISLRNTTIINHVRDKDQLRWISRRLIDQADLLIANSKKVASFLAECGVTNDIEVIYNGVDITRFNHKSYTWDQPTILFIGQLYPRKGVDYLLRAFKKVLEMYPEARLQIVGEDMTPNQEYRPLYQKLAQEQGIQDKVTWLGYRTDVPDLLAQSEIFVLPALEEPFGRVVIEAMSASVPVVATEVGGIPEILQEGVQGYIVEPGNEEALSQAMIALLKQPSMSEDMGVQGRLRVQNHFSLDTHVKRIESCYSKFLDRQSV